MKQALETLEFAACRFRWTAGRDSYHLCMPQEYRKNHTASVCYLQGFEAKNGRVQVTICGAVSKLLVGRRRSATSTTSGAWTRTSDAAPRSAPVRSRWLPRRS